MNGFTEGRRRGHSPARQWGQGDGGKVSLAAPWRIQGILGSGERNRQQFFADWTRRKDSRRRRRRVGPFGTVCPTRAD